MANAESYSELLVETNENSELFFQVDSDSDSGEEGEAGRLARIRGREAAAARPWHQNQSAPNARSLTFSGGDSEDGPSPCILDLGDFGKVLYREQCWPPHGGEIVATGAIVWDSALVLAKYLEHTNGNEVRGASVVELGAGLGVPSLAALRCGARHVCITDVPDRLALLQNNAQLNDPAGTRCSVESLRWGDEISIAQVGLKEVILCSDVLFSDAAIPPLIATINAISTTGTTVITCCEHRWEGAKMFYRLLEEEGFTVSAIPLDAQHSVYRHFSIHMHRATKQSLTQTKSISI